MNKKCFAIVLIAALFPALAHAQQVLTIGPGGAVTAPVDQNGWRNFKLTLTQNVTSFSFALAAGVPTQATATVIFTENATGGFSVTFASNISANSCSVTTSANATTVCQFTYDGTTGTWNPGSSSSGASALSKGTANLSDSFARPDQTGLGTTLNGQTYTLTGANAANIAIQSNRYVLNTGAAGGTAYAYMNLGSQAITYGAKFSFAPNGGGSGNALIAVIMGGDPNNPLNKMVHTICSITACTNTWWNGASQNNTPQYCSPGNNGVFATPLVANGTVYSLSITVDGNFVYINEPDGSTRVCFDPNFSVVSGPLVIYELAYGSNLQIPRFEQTFAYPANVQTLYGTQNFPGGLNNTTIGANGQSDGFFNSIGIGTTTPKAPFHLLSSSSAGGFELGLIEQANNHATLHLKTDTAGFSAQIRFEQSGQTPTQIPKVYSNANSSDLRLSTNSIDRITMPFTGGVNILNDPLSALSYSTVTNCQLGGATGTASPAACGSAAAGMIAIPASQTTYTVNTTGVTANSEIRVTQVSDNSGLPSSPTCSATASNPMLSPGRVAGTSFTFTLTSVAAVTCYHYEIKN